jgi:phage tail sheath protein FI
VSATLLERLHDQIVDALAWTAGRANDETLWREVRRKSETILVAAWRSGELVGRRAEEAFFLRCDRTTMTQNDIDNGRLILLVGVAPAKPAEFVDFRVEQRLDRACFPRPLPRRRRGGVQ